MKKKTTRKRMAKQQNSVSENFIRRIRHSRKSQMFSVLVLAVGLVGIYLVIALLSPPNYGEGEGVGRRALGTRGESFRERISLRISDAFNRLRFVASGEKDNPEWIQPVLLPAPAEDVQKSLPDPTIFGSAEEQFIASLPEESREAVQQEEPAPAPASTPATQSVPSEDTNTPSGDNASTGAQPLGETCVYEKEYEA